MIPSDSRHEVPEEHHRLRLDRFLLKIRPDLGRHTVERLIRTGAVRVQGRPCGAKYFVKHGEIVELAPPAAAARAVPREILHSEDLIAIAKPPGMPTNPVHGKQDGGASGVSRDLLSWSIDYCREVGIPGTPGIVHRLDRDTSGVVIFSLRSSGHVRVEEAFRRRKIRKTYLTLVPGAIHPRRGTIDLPLLRDRSGRVRATSHGSPSQTEYRTGRSTGELSLLEVVPRTGRMHQVRAHLAAIGHPIAGDPLYGDARLTLGAPRLWLHAELLELPEALASDLGTPARIACPLWEDLQAHLQALGIDLIRPTT